MLLKEKHSRYSYLPQTLTQQEIAETPKFLTQLFEQTDISAFRAIMQQNFEVMISGNYHKQSTDDRLALLRFFNTLKKITEAAHLIYCRHQLTLLEKKFHIKK